MKHIFTPLAVVALVSSAAAQGGITITDENGQDVTNTSVTVTEPSTTFTMGRAFDAVLDGSSAEILVRRYELSVVDSTMNYFCWWECYAPIYAGDSPVWVSADPVQMNSGEAWEGFHAYYRPMGRAGTSCFRYVWYSETNAVDSVFMDICFEATVVGINELSAADLRLDVSPNPSSGDVTFSFDQTSAAQRQLVLHNALGERVSTMAVSGAQRRMVLEAGKLPSGVWFASLETDGRVLATRRFIISGH